MISPEVPPPGEEVARRSKLSDHEPGFSGLVQAVEQSPSIVLVTNRGGEIVYVNPTFTNVTGFRADEVLGKTPRVLRSGRVAAETYADMWRTILDGHIWRGDLVNRRKDGELYWGSASIAPVRDDQGTIEHFVEIMEDVTDRKQLEYALVRSIEEERRRIGADLHDTLGQELAGLSMLAKALARDADAAPELVPKAIQIAELAQQALQEARRLAQGLYPTVLERSGLASALAELAAQTERVTGIACEAHTTVRSSDHGVPVTRDDSEIRIDRHSELHLFRIAQEAVSNACRHARPTTVTIRLTFGESLTLEVTDDGIGIAAGDEARTDDSGMGLRLMRHRASLIGALIAIERRPPTGTVVRVELEAWRDRRGLSYEE